MDWPVYQKLASRRAMPSGATFGLGHPPAQILAAVLLGSCDAGCDIEIAGTVKDANHSRARKRLGRFVCRSISLSTAESGSLLPTGTAGVLASADLPHLQPPSNPKTEQIAQQGTIEGHHPRR